MAPGPSFDPDGVEQALRCLPAFELKGLFRRSSNYTFLAELRGRVGVELEETVVLAVYKPAEGESPLWDFPAGTLYRREVAAYLLAKFLGWPRVPPTVIRETAPHGVGALQLFVEAEAREHYLVSQGQPDETWLQVAAFDVVTNNADRKSGHCLTDGDRRVWVIDHGLTFNVEPKLRTVIWDYAGQPLPAPQRLDLERAAASLDGGELRESLGELLTRRELAMLRRRTHAAAATGWQMPHPTSAWSVPWPPV